jgi:hypothetical protein
MIRATFRVLTLKLAKLKVPMLVTNHTYDVIGAYMPTKTMSGGGGLKYAASTIVILGKRKDRDADKDVVGSIITCAMGKSRFTKENQKAEVQLSHNTGLNRYYGLLDVFLEAGKITKDGNRYVFPDGQKAFKKAIDADPAAFFTQTFLEQMDTEVIGPMFKYGEGGATSSSEEDSEEGAAED